MKEKTDMRSRLLGFAERLKRALNIRADMADAEEIHERISSGARISGTNLYVLIAAIFIASIGLNMNSTAVIIGAMLISPLMGSIIGIGYGLATKQSLFTKRSLEGLLRQLGISLVTSTVYFLVSPITAPSNEILARTAPTVWDILIAVFGGAAGIIGQTRREKANNIIPGVAIATALMPPVCTAGYGIANGRWRIAAGALDLFLVNCLCILITTYLFTKILRLNNTPDTLATSKKWMTRITILLILVFLPTGYFAYGLVANQETESKVSSFVNERFAFDETQVIKYSYAPDTGILSVTLVGNSVEEDELNEIRAALPDYGLADATLKVTQTNSDKAVSAEELDDIIAHKLKSVLEEIDSLKKDNASLSEEISNVKEENASLSRQLEEMTTAEPEPETGEDGEPLTDTAETGTE